jgi:hypothetical protein
MAANDLKVILWTPNDWEDFEQEFLRKANAMKLLDYILGKEELMSKPLMPNLDMFKKSRQQSVVIQPIPTTSPDTQLTVQGEDGESTLEGVVHYSSLTEQAQCAYHFAYNMY